MHRMVVGMVEGLERSCGAGGRQSRRHRAVAGLTMVVLFGSLFTAIAAAQAPPRTRPSPAAPALPGKGASDAAAPPSAPAITREELLRRFDLNFDGKIDQTEGEIGRSKMRAERKEEEERQQREHDMIDPLTGRPREEAKEIEPKRKRRIISIDDLLPGADDPADANDVDPGAADPSRGGGSPGSKERPRSAARQMPAAPAPGNGRPGLLSGGLRAGAPPARPGYGAPSTPPTGGSKSSRPLNAGRPAGSLLPGSATARPAVPAAGNAGSRAAPAGGNPAAGQAPRLPQTGRSSAPQAPPSAPRVPLFPPPPIN
ncbi:MAG: hypothetical protein EXS06_01320 [Planctomycetaceae bacterium]|nr:hypothetical protein [Planctomycetaceae bacterium]